MTTRRHTRREKTRWIVAIAGSLSVLAVSLCIIGMVIAIRYTVAFVYSLPSSNVSIGHGGVWVVQNSPVWATNPNRRRIVVDRRTTPFLWWAMFGTNFAFIPLWMPGAIAAAVGGGALAYLTHGRKKAGCERCGYAIDGLNATEGRIRCPECGHLQTLTTLSS